MKYLLLSSLMLLSTSCSTITNGRFQQVAFNSEPPGANVWVNQKFMGVTPTHICLKRADPHMVRIELEGYKPYEVQLIPTVSGWVFGNLLFGGLIGIAVDAATGSMYKLAPNQLHACLVATPNQIVSHITNSEECQVMVLSEVDPSWEKIGTLEPSL